MQGTPLVPVLHFEYLGSFLSADGSLTKEIETRAQNSTTAFRKLPRGLWESEMALWIKWELYKHLIMPILLFGAEAWAPSTDDITRMESVLVRHIRCMTNLSWSSGPTPEQRVLPPRSAIDAVGAFPSMESILQSARLRLYGQITRAGPYSFLGKWTYMITATDGFTPRGPKKIGWRAMVSGDLIEKGLSAADCFAIRDWKTTTSYEPRGPRRLGDKECL